MDGINNKQTSFRNIISKMIIKIKVFFLKRKLNNIQRTLIQLWGWLVFKLVNKHIQKHRSEDISYRLKLSRITVSKLLDEIVLDEQREFYEKEKNIIEEEINSIGDSQEIKQFIYDYYLIKSFLYDTSMNEELSKLDFEKSLKYCEDTKKLTNESFVKKRNEIKKRYKLEKKKFWKLRDEIVSNKMFSMISKIEVSTQKITYLFGILTTIFVLTGYIYNRFFLGYFGIDVSHFFTIGDYLSTSIDKIYISCLSVLTGTFFYILGIYDGFKTVIKNELLEISPRKDSSEPPLIITGIMFSITTVIYFYLNIQGKYTVLSIVIFILLMVLYHKINIDKYFKKPFHVSIFVVSMIFFSVNMFSSIMNDKDDILRKNVSDLRRYNFTYDKGIKFNDNSWVFLSGNSGYFFFYDKGQHKSIIIPKILIKSIESVKK